MRSAHAGDSAAELDLGAAVFGLAAASQTAAPPAPLTQDS